jgi:uncharacterized protein YbcI
MPEAPKPADSVRMQISDAVVGVVRDYTGRGPTSARTTIDRDVVYVFMKDTLTKGETVLVQHGRAPEVMAMRKTFQEAMRLDLEAAVERVLGRRVVAFMSANHAEPDCSVEIFVLGEPVGPGTD